MAKKTYKKGASTVKYAVTGKKGQDQGYAQDQGDAQDQGSAQDQG